MIDILFLSAAALTAITSAHGPVAKTNTSGGPTAAVIKRIVQQNWDGENSAYKLTWGAARVQAITKSNCQPIFGWGNAKTPFHRVFRCTYAVSYKTLEGAQAAFDDLGVFERVDGNWRTFKGPSPPLPPPTEPSHGSN